MAKKIPVDNTRAISEFIKSLSRPFTNLIFVALIAIMTYEGRFEEIPIPILAAGGVHLLEYGWERAKKRLREMNKSPG